MPVIFSQTAPIFAQAVLVGWAALVALSVFSPTPVAGSMGWLWCGRVFFFPAGIVSGFSVGVGSDQPLRVFLKFCFSLIFVLL